MIRVEHPDFHQEKESQETERMGFIELITEQDIIRDRIEEIELQIQSLTMAKNAGDSIDETRLKSLQEQLENANIELQTNEIALGRVQTPNIPQ